MTSEIPNQRAATEGLLTVEGLTVTFPTGRGPVDVVRDLSFTVERARPSASSASPAAGSP